MKTIDEALQLTSETYDVDFKSHFEPTNIGEVLELTKDIVAMANSGGGLILIGLDDNGLPVALEEDALRDSDPAFFGDKILKYTDANFNDFEISVTSKSGSSISVISVGPAIYPIVFSKTGNYQTEGNKQKNAFLQGMLYFRHGAKSEPACSEDLRAFFDRKIEDFRKRWIEGIARIVEAPAGSTVEILPPGIRHAPDAKTAIRLTSDPSAPAYHAISVDETHPFRQKELVVELQSAIGTSPKINAYHISCARKDLKLDADKQYVFKLAHASPQYSRECLQFLIDKHKADPNFFTMLPNKFRKNKKDS